MSSNSGGKKQYSEPQWYREHIWDSYYRYQGRFEEECDLLVDGSGEVDVEMVVGLIEN